MPAKRGFASLDKEKLREIAASGGRAVSPENRSFSQDRMLASAAGRKGGCISADNKRDRKYKEIDDAGVNR